MPRKGRKSSVTGMYHVFVRGISYEFIFNQTREKRYFKRIIKKYIDKYNVEIYAYCIMSNHAHLLLKSEKISDLSKFMSRILAEYATYYNYKRQRNGHVFQNRFKSEAVETSTYFWNCLKYIHMNPVKAKIVSDFNQYKFSSIGEYKSGKYNILHENAMKMYKEKFKTWDRMIAFHGVANEMVFVDTAEEMKEQYLDLAWNVLWEMQEEMRCENIIEVFEDTENRKRYFEMIKETLDLSDAKTKILCKNIENALR